MPLRASTLYHLDDLMRRLPEIAPSAGAIKRAAAIIADCGRAGGTLLVCGNGGSASDSEHIVGEMMKGFVLKREVPEADVARLHESGVDDWQHIASHLQRGIRAIALTGHTPLTTAVLNDTDPHMTFAQQAYVYGRPGDVLIGLSTSGGAKNVANALKVARAFGLSTIGLTGSRPSPMDALCDVMIKAPTEVTFRVQEYHLPIYHTICLMVEEELFGRGE